MTGKPVREYAKTSYLENRISKIKYPTSVRREKETRGKEAGRISGNRRKKRETSEKRFLNRKERNKAREAVPCYARQGWQRG